MMKRAILSFTLHLFLLKGMDWLLRGIMLSWSSAVVISGMLMVWTICYPRIYRRFHIRMQDTSVFWGALFIHGLVFFLTYRFMRGVYINNVLSGSALSILLSAVEYMLWKAGLADEENQ